MLFFETIVMSPANSYQPLDSVTDPSPLRVIDTHAHLCHPQKFSYIWAKRDPHDLIAVDAASFFEDTSPAGVEKMVFVEAAVEPAQHFQELAFAEEQSLLDPRVAGFIAAAPAHPNEMAAKLERLASHPLVRGIRFLSRYAPRPEFLLEKPIRELMEKLSSLGLICEIGVWAQELPIVAQLARNCPETIFILNHAGKPNIAGGELEPWAQDLRRLAQHPNVLCKLSGLATLAGLRGFSREILAPFVCHVVEVFGPERVMYGSDWPMASTSVHYLQRITAVRQSLSDLSREELDAVFKANAERIYRI
ncbi:amidohydrolase family protein (plasmid) [Mesorhizobium sp. AR10]|uniref:amidohydrolase family protein n=1 Tax=Mesorhizobium sp. AR10 TaxID=2865839 RepID=UPI00215EAA8A|nr:amidohydrolase family protein [Mesorhizobium sp. AR10]UVK35512.1 amidohydrolase family protein [Mesorhizobium sp. AR10]